MSRRKTVVLGIACAVTTMLATPSVGSAEEPAFYNLEYDVSDQSSQPCNITSTPDGAMWVSLHGANQLARLDPVTGDVAKFDMPRKLSVGGVDIAPLPAVFGLGTCDMAYASDGNLWFNHQAANTVGYIETQYPFDMHEISLPTPASIPMSLATGADGYVYVTSTGANKITRVDPRTHDIEEFIPPTPVSGIIGGTAGTDGAHWFVEMASNKLLRFDYETHAMEEFKIPGLLSLPFVIRANETGLWFTLTGAGAIGHFDPATKQFSTIPLSNPLAAPIGITFGKDGFIYTNQSVADSVARIDPNTLEVVAEYPYPSRLTFPIEIKSGPDGAIWTPNYLTGKVTRLWVKDFGSDPGFPGVDR